MKPHNNDRADLIKKWFLEQPPEVFCTPSRFEAAITDLLSHIESDGWQTMETLKPGDGLVWLLLHSNTVRGPEFAEFALQDPTFYKAWMPCHIPAPPETKEG